MALNASPTYAITPSQTKQVLPTNYVSLYDFSSVYLPDTHEEMARIYGNQSVAGMLYLLGAESSLEADQSIWTEEGRLHTVYTDVTRVADVFTKTGHTFRVNETIHISDASAKGRAIITAVTANTFTAVAYKTAGHAFGTTALTVFVDGSEFRKGVEGMQGSLEKDLTIRRNKPIILKDRYETSGSDATNIGWVKTSTGGYLWYLESEFDTRRRWEDRLELALVLGQVAESGSDAETANFLGTEGMFEAIESRGNVFAGVIDSIASWDTVVKRFDAQGKIADYTYYVNRGQSLDIDNDLGTLNAGYSGGVSYGMFDNSESMAVNLGFTGFRRGSYSFHKTDWKVLNDPSLLGAVAQAAGGVNGVLIPIGTTEVYDGAYNGMNHVTKNKVPYLHAKHKASGAENRKYKTWVTGTVGGVYTNEKDSMSVHHLSERLLNVVGANNFLISEGA